MPKTSRRRIRGGAIAEVPVGLWLLLVGFLLPLLFIATWGLKIVLVYWSTRDACYAAAKAATWDDTTTGPGAVTSMTNTYTRDMAAFNAASWTVGGYPNLNVMKQTVGGGYGSASALSGPLPTPIDGTKLYFMRVKVLAKIPPLISGWKWIGLTIPGFTSPQEVSMNYQVYVENPNGLAI